MTLFDADDKLPQPEVADHAMAVLKAAVGTVPVLGAAGVQLVEYIVTPALDRRRTDWFNDLAERVRRLESQRGIPPDQLRDNPAFIDAVVTATQAAIRTSSKEKHRALQNAILNSGLPGGPQPAVQQIFLSLVDRLSELHIALLGFAREPWSFRTQPRRTATEVLHDVFPDASKSEPLYRLVWSDLYAAGLVTLPVLENGYEGDATKIKRTSDFGDAFMRFITSPLPEN